MNVSTTTTDIYTADLTRSPETPLEYALHYTLRLGWKVFPVWGCDEAGRCRCGRKCNSPGKHPVSHLAPRGHLDATTDETIIMKWWNADPDAGVAVSMAASGLVGIDIDPRNGGEETIEKLEAVHGRFESDVVQLTQSGGQHWIYTAPPDTQRLPGKLGPGVDVKYNGYLVVEPTRGPQGRYEWEGSSDPIETGVLPSALPDWIRDFGLQTSPEPVASGAVRHVDERQLDELRDALKYIDADDYHNWINMGLALSTIGAKGFPIWDEWSATSSKYKPGETWHKWRSFRNDKANNLNIESIFHLARQNGWRPAPVVTVSEEALPDVTPQPAEQEVPEHLLTVPGFLGEAVAWINRTARKSQPLFAVQTALAFGAAIAGRRYVTDNGNWPALYFLNIAKSASGKEHAKWALESLLEAVCAADIIGPNGYKSDSAVISALLHRPNHVTVVDEFGRYLKAAANRNQAHQANALTMLMEVWGRADGAVRPPGMSTFGLNAEQARELLEQRTVRHPSLTLVAMTTPETFYQSVGSGALTDGFLNRFIIVESRQGRQPGRIVAPTSPPDSLIQWARAVRGELTEWGLVNPDESAAEIPQARRVSFSATAVRLFAEFEQTCIGLMDEYEADGLAEMFGRTTEIAMRLSLIVALSCQSSAIEAEHAQWAIDYARHWAQDAAENLKNHVADSEFGAVMKKVYAQIRKGGPKGRTMAELSRNLRSFDELTMRQREEVLRALEGSERIVQMEIRSTSGRGRKRLAWVATEFAPVEVSA